MPKKAPPLTPDQHDQFKVLWDDKVGINKIARQMGVGEKALLKHAHQRDWTRDMPNSLSYKWDEDEQKQAMDLWNSGLSAQKIGVIMGTKEKPLSKNTVIGRLERLGLIGGRGEPRGKRVIVKKAFKQNFGPARAAPYVPPPEAITEPEGDQFRIHDMSDKVCKWPIKEDKDGLIYCCRPRVPGRPYCEYHTNVGYVKPRPPASATDFRLRRNGI